MAIIRVEEKAQCTAQNWVNNDRCVHVTHLKCDECGKATCGTHRHWHKDGSAYFPVGVCRNGRYG